MVLGGAASPGPLNPPDPEELGAAPTVGSVTTKWKAADRTKTPEIHGKGTTLADLKADLDASQGKHWGEGGGKLTMDPVPFGVKSGETFTVTLNGEFINRIPIWDDRATATTTAQKEWDRFIGKLNDHEEGHVSVALAAFEQLAKDLIGVKITDLATKVAKAQTDLTAAQKKMDTDTDNGTKSGAEFGDALLDAAIK